MDTDFKRIMNVVHNNYTHAKMKVEHITSDIEADDYTRDSERDLDKIALIKYKAMYDVLHEIYTHAINTAFGIQK